MIDFHSHTLISDGELLPTELARRAKVKGYTALGITDHVDVSNIEEAVGKLLAVCDEINRGKAITVIPGVELTHIPPERIPAMVKKARRLGARLVIGHGETLMEPVEPGTNDAYIRCRVDILAHPGLVTEAECRLAAKNSVLFEITSRRGHSISNGHVAKMARKFGVGMVVDTDTHSPGDLIDDETARRVAIGAGLDPSDFEKIKENAQRLLEKTSS